VSITLGVSYLEDELEATGVPVCRDVANFQGRCVIVESPRVIEQTQGSGFVMEVPVWLVASQPATRTGLDWLLENLPAVMRACQTGAADPGTYSPNGSLNFPAYRLVAIITSKG
jgi:hypothetical protein